MGALVTLHAELNTPQIPVTGQPRLVYLLVELQNTGAAQTLPANIGLVLDASDSMRIRLLSEAKFAELMQRGQAKEVLTDGVPAWQIETIANEDARKFPRRIDYVYEALQAVSEYLRPVDYFSLVAFASQAVTVIPQTEGHERVRLGKASKKIELLDLGDETHIAEGLAAAFTEMQRTPNGHYAQRLVLLTDGYDADVRSCYTWAQKSRRAEVPITTIGIGAEFNEDLLINLAEITGASAYYVETPDQLPGIFHQEFHAALAQPYRNLRLQCHLTKNVNLRQAYRVLPELSMIEKDELDPQKQQIYLGHQMPQTLLLELVLPPWGEGNYRVAQLGLEGEDLNGRHNLVSGVNVVVTLSSQFALPFEPHIMQIVDKVGAYKLGTHTLQQAQSGHPKAHQLLQQAAQRYQEVGEPQLAAQMETLALSLQAKKALDPLATKRLRYETRKITRQL